MPKINKTDKIGVLMRNNELFLSVLFILDILTRNKELFLSVLFILDMYFIFIS